MAGQFDELLMYQRGYLSCVTRNLIFAYAKNKGADQLLISAFVFCYIDSTNPLLPKHLYEKCSEFDLF